MPCELERMQLLLTKGLTETASLWSDIKLGYAWVHRAAHVLANDEKLSAIQVRHDYEQLLTEMEQRLSPLRPLLRCSRHFAKSPPVIGLASFNATMFLISHAPTMSWSSISAQRATMNDGRPGENRLPQAWWCVEPFGWRPRSLPVCISSPGQSFVRLISPAGVLCGAN